MTSDLPKRPEWQISRKMRARARSLRRESTGAERKVWNALHAHRFSGASFRRQTPIGPYIVDFVCHAAKLVVEIDGGQHFQAEHLRKDSRRDSFLNRKGFRVLRFNNHEVMTNLEGVLTVIHSAIGDAPSLSLPRKRGRKEIGARIEQNNGQEH